MTAQEVGSTYMFMLPVEVLVEIFRWVVSSYLDIESMRNMALVCRWFYTCSRVEVLWRSMCIRVWGVACQYPCSYSYCWRRMYLKRFHIEYSGIYISSIKFMRRYQERRYGYYRPHHCQYFKYIRFFPNGTVIIYTTEGKRGVALPVVELPVTKSAGMSLGHFEQEGDTIQIVTATSSKPRLDRRNQRGITNARETYSFLTLNLGRHDNCRYCHLDLSRCRITTFDKITKLQTTHDNETIQYRAFQFFPIESYVARAHTPL